MNAQLRPSQSDDKEKILMKKCKHCHKNEAIWAWQPFGPDEDPQSSSRLGYHTRGFPMIQLCDFCFDLMCDNTENGFVFLWKRKPYILVNGKVKEGPF